MEGLYQCQECHQVFRLPGLATGEVGKCPGCGSRQVKSLPAWVPLGADLGEGTPQWEYQCQGCKHAFKRPVPASPAEEQGIACPTCGGRHIHRLTPINGEPLYCG